MGGIQGDLGLFQTLGIPAASVVTAIEARDKGRLRREQRLPARIIEAQIDAVVAGGEIGAVKIGPLPSWQIAATIAGRVRRRRLVNGVLEPGLLAPGGERLLGAKGADMVRRFLLPRVRAVVLRPEEAYLLVGRGTEDEEAGAAGRLGRLGVETIVVVGYDGRTESRARWYTPRAIQYCQTSPAPGTVAAVLAAQWASGNEVEDALEVACTLVTPRSSSGE